MKFKMMCAALTATTIAPAAMAEFEISFDVAGLEAGFVNVDAANDYAGRDILRVGYRDMVIENTALGANQAQFGWSLDLSALEYGINFFSLAAPVDLTIGSNTIADIEHDVSGYLALVAPENSFFGAYNLGAGVFGADYTVTAGEMYFVLDGEPVPAPGALALIGLAGLVARRRRA